MSGFSGALGVVKVELSTGTHLATLPTPMRQASHYAQDLAVRVAGQGDGGGLVDFEIAGGALDCWIRAREVVSIEVVSTEDPGAGS